MGLLNWARNKHLNDPVAGTYQLTSCSAGANDAAYANCSMHGVVAAPGVPAVAVAHSCMAPTKKWPVPGQTLPVLVDRHDPTRFHIQWDELVRTSDLGQQLAEQQAQAMNQGVAPLYPSGVPLEDQAGSFTSPPAGPAVARVSVRVNGVPQQFATPGTRPVVTVVGDPSRAVPGAPGGGLSPEQSAQAGRDGGASLGLQAATATVLAVHDVATPPGTPGVGAGGLADLTLDIALSDGPGFSTRMRLGFTTPTRRAALTVIGRTLPVLVNPSEPDQIAIDVARLGSLPD